MASGTTIAKNVFISINFVILCVGLLLFSYGLFFWVSSTEHDVDRNLYLLTYLIVPLASITIVASVYGCLAAKHEKTKNLLLYVGCLLALLLFQSLLVGTFLLRIENSLQSDAHESWVTIWKAEQKEPGALKFYEKWQYCCGVNGIDDYASIQHEIPESCQKSWRFTHSFDVQYFTRGCKEAYDGYLYGVLLAFRIILWVLIVCEIAATLCSWYLLRIFTNQHRRENGWMAM